MSTKKTPTETGQGVKKGASNIFVAIRAGIVKALLIMARIGQAGGAR